MATFPEQGREHLTSDSPLPSYNSDPPTSGPHAPNTVPCGIHEKPIPDVVAVHNLEHGVVIVYYSPDISAAELSLLTSTVVALPSHAVLAPRPSNPALMVVTAWRVLLALDEVDLAGVQWFWETYQGQGPEVADCPIELGLGG